MKQIKLFSVVLLLATMCIGFNACSSDDDGGGTTLNPKSKRISTITNEFEGETRVQKFTYTNDKLTRYIVKYNNGDDRIGDDEADLKITYNGNTVTMVGEYDNNTLKFIYSLNNGLATSCKLTYTDESTPYITNYTFDYSKDGYLIGMRSVSSDDNEVVTLSYTDGNMMEMTDKYQSDPIDTYKYSYSNEKNIGAIMNPFIRGNIVFYFQEPAYYAGILGKGTANLATKEIKAKGEFICTYSIGNDGLVKNAIVSDGNRFSYTFE